MLYHMKLTSSYTTCEIYVEVELQSCYYHSDHDAGQTSFVQLGFQAESNNMLPTPACESKNMVVESEYERMLHDKPNCRKAI